jgi:hypothetical protein
MLKHVDERRLETDLASRYEFLREFMGFADADVAALHAAAPLLAPLVPGLVDAVYDHLFSYDATKRHFLVRQSGFDGVVPDDLDRLSQDHEMIQFRKTHLAGYLSALVTRPYDMKMVQFLDHVGRIHTPQAGNPRLSVPLVQMNALMGFVSDALISTIVGLGLDRATEVRTLRAVNRLLWLQNDLITRHYQGQSAS